MGRNLETNKALTPFRLFLPWRDFASSQERFRNMAFLMFH